MVFRLASYNVENLFLRPVAMNQATWSEGKAVLTNHAALNAIIAKDTYTASDKNRMVGLLTDLGLAKSDETKFVILRRNRGALLRRSAGTIEIIANGRDEWIGWLSRIGPSRKDGPSRELRGE